MPGVSRDYNNRASTDILFKSFQQYSDLVFKSFPSLIKKCSKKNSFNHSHATGVETALKHFLPFFISADDLEKFKLILEKTKENRSQNFTKSDFDLSCFTMEKNYKWKVKDGSKSHCDIIHFLSFCVGKIIESYTKNHGCWYKTPWCESSAPDSRSLQLYAIIKLIGDSNFSSGISYDPDYFIALKKECNVVIGHNSNINLEDLNSFWDEGKITILQKYLHEVVDKYESKLVEPHNK